MPRTARGPAEHTLSGAPICSIGAQGVVGLTPLLSISKIRRPRPERVGKSFSRNHLPAASRDCYDPLRRGRATADDTL